MAEGTVSTTLSEWLLVALIIASLLFEFALHRVEHWIQTRHHHLVAVVRVLYRELMILGLVSFLFILYETIAKPNGSVILSFEFAHVFIFLLAIFYTVVVLSTMFTSLRLSSRWKKMEQMDLVHYLNLKDKYSQLRRHVHRRHDAAWRLFWWFPNLAQLLHYSHMHEVMAFHDIRFQFIYYRNLPEHFRFSSFLRKIKSITFIELVESHWSLYIIFLVIVVGDIVRRHVTMHGDTEFDLVESVFIVSSAVILAICVQILAVKIRGVYWQLTKHPRTYYEGVEAGAVAEELKRAADERLLRQREDRRSRSSRAPSMDVDTGNDADDESVGRSSLPDVHPEVELLDPMHSQPVSAPLMTNTAAGPNGSPDSNRVSFEVSSEVVNYPSALRQTSAIPSSATGVNHRRKVSFEVMERAMTDLAATQAARFSLSERPDVTATSPDGDAIEDTLARHSLDVPRGNVPSMLGRGGPSGPPSFSASMARAAVEAARSRTAANGSTVSSNDVGNDRTGTRSTRASMDVERRSPQFLGSPLLSRRVSTDDDVRGSIGADGVRSSIDSRGRRGGRMSIELAVVMPRDELAAHFEQDASGGAPGHPREDRGDVGNVAGIADGESSGDGEARGNGRGVAGRIGFRNGRGRGNADGRVDGVGSGHVSVDMGDGHEGGVDDEGDDGGILLRAKSLGFRNPTILKNLEHQRLAQNTQPARYPKLVTKLIPRLGRVASPVEKLFWFGSHKFFLWCVEFVLFFSAVLLAAASAGLSLIPLSGKKIQPMNIVALVLAVVNLMFVLLRIAGIMKRYIFILHNASLIPEVVAIEAIHNVRGKRLFRDDASSMSGSETEREEDDAARERRRRLGRFFRSEAESGNVPGIEGGSRNSRTSWDRSTRRRLRKRMVLRRRNKNRLRQLAVDEDEGGEGEGSATGTGTGTGTATATGEDVVKEMADSNSNSQQTVPLTDD